tara:strand:+ start:593 stop:958 length:366 start_codon:yes stop_codon:yes gene_type:complete
MSMKKRNNRGIITEKKIRITRGRLQKIIQEALDSWPLVGDDEGPMLDNQYARVLGDGGKAKMSRGQLFRLAQKAQALHAALDDEDELPEWVQSKIATTNDRLQSVYDHVIYKLWQIENEGK